MDRQYKSKDYTGFNSSNITMKLLTLYHPGYTFPSHPTYRNIATHYHGNLYRKFNVTHVKPMDGQKVIHFLLAISEFLCTYSVTTHS